MRARHFVVALAAFAATGLRAQSSAITTNATVVTPITVTGMAPLDWGTIAQNSNNNLNPNNASSGRFSVTGLLGAQVALTFTLPDQISNGGSTMPVTNYSIRVNETNSTGGSNNLAVTSGTAVTQTLTTGSLFFFIGGRVSAAPAQQWGVYTGTITLAAAYTGL